MGDQEAVGEHFAGDLGVDAFVPIGEAVVAEQGEEDQRGEQHGERSGEGSLPERKFAGLVLGCHGNNIRDAG